MNVYYVNRLNVKVRLRTIRSRVRNRSQFGDKSDPERKSLIDGSAARGITEMTTLRRSVKRSV
jgi:hypothetical protein